MLRAPGVLAILAPALLGTVALRLPRPAPGPTPQAANLAGLEWRSIGPATTGGRIADFAVAQVKGEPDVVYVASTTGGVFKSSNAGVSWTPIFDHAGGMMSVGAVAVAPSDPSIVWVGTGEADNRQSSSWGDGVYKSEDGGAHWQNMGLEDTHHIGRIVVDPRNPNVVWVAAVGHLWGSNPERGVYKTTDGGKTWKKVLYANDNTGCTDLALDPHNPDVVFAAMYQRQRKGWGFNGGGPGSGIYRTRDGGDSWTELKSGLPAGDKGRIGLAIYPGDSRIVYAIVEADPPAAAGRGGASAPPAAAGRGGRGAAPPGAIAQRGGIFRSDDQGESWQHMAGLDPRPSYYSQIRVDPTNPDRVYIVGSERGFYVSDDAGRNWRDVFSQVHGEDHALWIDPHDPNHMVVGGDGGVSISYDRGVSWLFRINLPIGQFYNIDANDASRFLVCGGLQDNGNWCTPSATSLSYGLSNRDAFNVGGGDGMQAVFDGNDHTLLVSSQNGSTQRLDLDTWARQSIAPVPPPEKPPAGRGGRGASGYRWYWTAPLLVSHFDPNVIYTGANLLFRSNDRGASWKAISGDLTTHTNRDTLEMMGAPVPPNALSRNDGQDSWGALTAIAESPLDRNLLYTGSDDGQIEITRDGGQHWTVLNPNVPGLPPSLNISGLVASAFSPGRVYLTVDGHFNDDYRPYIYVSEDYGQHWQSITSGLPQTSVHRLRESPTNPDFLVAGLEEGVYASFDRGGHWTSLDSNMPPVPVYDLVFQRSAHALIAGTHGRGIWILDDADPLSQLTDAAVAEPAHLFPIAPARRQLMDTPQAWFGAGEFFAPNPPSGAVITYYLAQAGGRGGARLAILDSAGKTVRTLRAGAQAGMNRACWDLRLAPAAPAPGQNPVADAACAPGAAGGGRGGRGAGGPGPYAQPGTYTVSLTLPGGATVKGDLTVAPDAYVPMSAAEAQFRNREIDSAYQLQRELVSPRDAAAALSTQLDAMRQFLQAAGAPAASSLAIVEKAAADLTAAETEISGAMTSAAAAQNGMDGYPGPPTEVQTRALGWAWEDAAAGAKDLNALIEQQMPAVYAAMGHPVAWPKVPSVTVPLAPAEGR